jgi:hypothetical protein
MSVSGDEATPPPAEINGRKPDAKKIIAPINAEIFQYSNFFTCLKSMFTHVYY